MTVLHPQIYYLWLLYGVAVLCCLASCGGMSKETVRRSTFMQLSVHGKTKKMPVDEQGQKAWISTRKKSPCEIPFFFLFNHKWFPPFSACTTWSLGLPVCDATQSEDYGALVLLNDLRVEHNTGLSLHSKFATKQEMVVFCSFTPLQCWFPEYTHLHTKPDGDGEEESGEEARHYDYEPTDAS